MANSPDREFQKVVEMIQRGDVTTGNQEGVFFDLGTFKVRVTAMDSCGAKAPSPKT
jgi:hypothetical protein